MSDHLDRVEAAIKGAEREEAGTFVVMERWDNCVAESVDVADLRALCAEVRALRAEREAFITEALDNDRVADLMRSLVTAGRNRMNLGTALAYWPPFERFTRVTTPTSSAP